MDLLVSGNYLLLFAFNQCLAKADISGDVYFLFRKLYQVSVIEKCVQYEAKAKQLSWMPMQVGCKGKICYVVTIANVEQNRRLDW